jgi:pyridoxine/pyridoxamine 5'-phosphate oxidase
MDTTFEIFRDDPQGPLWIESVVGLERAAQRLANIYKLEPATYFAYDPRESRIVAKLSYESKAIGPTDSLRRKGASNAA